MFKQQCLLYELKMMREVNHPNLLHILEIFEGDNNIYCLGKIYKGESLATMIHDKKKRIEEDIIKNFAYKMLQVELILLGSGLLRKEVNNS